MHARASSPAPRPAAPPRPAPLLAALAVAATWAAVAGTAACGPGILSPATPPPPLFHLRVETQSALDVQGDVRGALAWSVYSDELVACFDALAVDGPLDLSLVEDPVTFEYVPADPQAYLVLQQMQSCIQFSERGHVETDSVAVEPQFPSSFTIPVAALPSDDVLTGHPDALLGIGDVFVYLDDDGDGAFSETPLGASAFVDRVVGTSLAWREDDLDESFLVWREGEVSSVWKYFRALYGCADPAEGFSTVTLRFIEDFSEDGPFVECTVDSAAIPVELDDTALTSLACAADPDRHVPQRPSDDVGLPAGAVGECVQGGDGWSDVRYTLQGDSVCPDVERYDLVGCSDLTSEAACRATSWDLVGEEPAWWPCRFGAGELSVSLTDDPAGLGDGVDPLFDLAIFNGFASFRLEDLAIGIETPDGDVVVSGEALTLHDADNNGAWSNGDTLSVRELDGSSFTADIVPGVYTVHIYVGGIELQGLRGNSAWIPVAIPQLPPLEITGADHPDAVSFDVDRLAFITWTAGAHDPVALEDVHVDCYLGGELPVRFARNPPEGVGRIALTGDADGDGLFSQGDTLTLVEAEPVEFNHPIDPDIVASFSGVLFCSLSLDVGFNAFVHAGSTVLGLDGADVDF